MVERSPNEEISESVRVDIGACQAVPAVESIISFSCLIRIVTPMMKMIMIIRIMMVMLMFTQTGLQSYLLLTPVGPGTFSLHLIPISNVVYVMLYKMDILIRVVL